MNILYLNLKKKWFDMVLSGEKKEEYRDLKPYWLKRLYFNDNTEAYDQNMTEEVITELKNKTYSNKDLNFWAGWVDRSFGKIKFTNGYSKNAPSFEIECNEVEIRRGNPEWGAEPGCRYFVLKLGNVIEPLVDYI